MRNIVVNDTNVFIDLLEIGLLDEFFQLPWTIHTTEFVLLELHRVGQKDAVMAYQAKNLLHVVTFEANELLEISKLHKEYEHKTNVTMTDCSVWYYAKREGYILLTGDKKLRTSSQKEGLEVHGILYVFDALVDEMIISPVVAAEILVKLLHINSRLPKDEIVRRIQRWHGVCTS